MILAARERLGTTAGPRRITRSQARFCLARLSAEIGTARFRVPISNGVQIIGGGDGGSETLLRASIPEGVRVAGHRRYVVLAVANPIIRRCPLARPGTTSMLSTASNTRSAGIFAALSRRHARPSNREPLDARLLLMPRRILPPAPQALKAPPGASPPAARKRSPSSRFLPRIPLRPILHAPSTEHAPSPFTAVRPCLNPDRADRPARNARPAQTGSCREPQRPYLRSRRGRARRAAPQPPARLRRKPQTGPDLDCRNSRPALGACRKPVPNPTSGASRRPAPTLFPRPAPTLEPSSNNPPKREKGRQGSPCRPR